MRRIDTLETYEALIGSGMPAKQARAQVDMINSSFKEILRDLKDEFVTTKVFNVYMGFLVTAVVAIGGELWSLSRDVDKIAYKLDSISERLDKNDMAKK